MTDLLAAHALRTTAEWLCNGDPSDKCHHRAAASGPDAPSPDGLRPGERYADGQTRGTFDHDAKAWCAIGYLHKLGVALGVTAHAEPYVHGDEAMGFINAHNRGDYAGAAAIMLGAAARCEARIPTAAQAELVPA